MISHWNHGRFDNKATRRFQEEEVPDSVLPVFIAILAHEPGGIP